MRLEKNFEEFIESLHENNVSYLIIGHLPFHFMQDRALQEISIF